METPQCRGGREANRALQVCSAQPGVTQTVLEGHWSKWRCPKKTQTCAPFSSIQVPSPDCGHQKGKAGSSLGQRPPALPPLSVLLVTRALLSAYIFHGPAHLSVTSITIEVNNCILKCKHWLALLRFTHLLEEGRGWSETAGVSLKRRLGAHVGSSALKVFPVKYEIGMNKIGIWNPKERLSPPPQKRTWKIRKYSQNILAGPFYASFFKILCQHDFLPSVTTPPPHEAPLVLFLFCFGFFSHFVLKVRKSFPIPHLNSAH